MIKILKILILISIFFYIEPSYSEKTLYLNKNLTQILSYENNIWVKLKKSDNFDIKIYWGNWEKISNSKKWIYIWIPYWIEKAEWYINVKYKNKEKKLNYKVYIENNYKDFDIYNSLFKKSLQKKSLSCEASATADILSTLKWYNITEDDVINKLKKSSYYNKKPEKKNWKWIWWNPNKWFVWYIDHFWDIKSKQKLLTWYGVYEKPIKNIYESYWLNTKIVDRNLLWEYFWTDKHLTYILKNLENWKMVQLWWDRCTDEKYEDGELKDKKLLNEDLAFKKINAKNSCYNTFSDRSLVWYYENNWELKKHIGLDWEHAFILLWWTWDINNPSHIKVWDTSTWFHEYETKEWIRKWSMMDYKSIIISI